MAVTCYLNHLLVEIPEDMVRRVWGSHGTVDRVGRPNVHVDHLLPLDSTQWLWWWWCWWCWRWWWWCWWSWPSPHPWSHTVALLVNIILSSSKTKQMERSHIHVHIFVHRVDSKIFFFSWRSISAELFIYRAISIRYAIFLRSFIPSKNSLYKKIIDQSDTKSVLSLVSRAVLIFTAKEQNSMKSCSCVKFCFTTLY